MSEEFDDDSNNEENSNFASVELKYQMYSDEKDNIVYIKFSGFENKQQMDNFIDYIDFSLPLLLHQSDTKH